jgi:hypothetical protein
VIPPLDARGLLPPGVHDATWAELALWFAGDLRRTRLQASLRRCLDSELRPPGWDCYPIVVAGSCLSDKPDPADIEVSLIATSAPDNVQSAIVLHFVRRKTSIKATYEVDYYPTLPGEHDFQRFFQYVGEKTAADKQLSSKDLRGVVRLIAW